MLALAGYLSVSLSYQLEHGDTWSVGDNAVHAESSREVAVHRLHEGYETQIAITVRNPGPLAVTLDEVSFDSADIAVGEVTMIERAGQGSRSCCVAADAEPFRPITLGTDDQVMVWLALRVTAVSPYPTCAGFTLESAGLRYQVLGIVRSQRLPLQTKIAFHSPCP